MKKQHMCQGDAYRQARRWCSMAICGNRAKQAAQRKRLKNKH
jgi:predicted RNA-binding Zn ribbon-like protein